MGVRLLMTDDVLVPLLMVENRTVVVVSGARFQMDVIVFATRMLVEDDRNPRLGDCRREGRQHHGAEARELDPPAPQ